MLKGIIKFMLVALFVSSITSCGVLQMTPGLTGSGVYELGEIGGVKYYTVHSSHFSGPNICNDFSGVVLVHWGFIKRDNFFLIF